MVVGQAPSYEVLAGVRNGWLGREVNLPGIENCLVAHDGHLSLIVAEWFNAENQFEEDHANAPNVNLEKWIKHGMRDQKNCLPFA
jgi:hypothetical protein